METEAGEMVAKVKSLINLLFLTCLILLTSGFTNSDSKLMGIKLNQHISQATQVLGNPVGINEVPESSLIEFEFNKKEYKISVITDTKSKIKSISVYGLKNHKVKLENTYLGDTFAKLVKDLKTPFDNYEFTNENNNFAVVHGNKRFYISKIRNILVVTGVELFETEEIKKDK